MDVLSGRLTIPNGGNVILIDKTIVTNGEYRAINDHADGYKDVTVALPLGTKSITQNGTYEASSENYQGYSSVNVNVQPTLGTKSITANGTYNASDSMVDGFSQVLVEVDTSVKNPVYRWWTNNDQTLIVREKISDGSFRWYFNNVYIPKKPFLSVPSNLSRFIKNRTIVGEWVTRDTYKYQVGFYDSTIRLWSEGLWYNIAGNATAIMESTDSDSSGSSPVIHTWEEPTFDPING